VPTTSSPTASRPNALRGLAAAALACSALIALVLLAPAAHGQRTSAKPNVIVLLTDDQEPSSLRVMDTVRKGLQRRGTTMKRLYANFPLCCPSRATMLTGQYAHNHGILSNVAPDGGYGLFNERHGNNYLPLWLQQRGYSTAYIGKYLNEYAEPDPFGTVPSEVPRGWDDWRVLAPSRAQYFGYTLNQNGSLTEFSNRNRDYSTDVFTTKAKRFIRGQAREESPFFLMLGYAAPHGGGGGNPGLSCNRAAVPAPRHLGELRKRKGRFGLPASFNEADVSDKPAAIQRLAQLSPGQISDVTRKRRCAWESLLAVDESVGEILAELERQKARRNTYVFFLSDNGYLRGEHRIRNNKRFLYEESARLPFVATGPGIARGEKSMNMATNADLTATILDVTGTPAGLLPDGESLVPSLRHPDRETGRAVLLEAYASQRILGVRTSRYLYTEWDSDNPFAPDIELYDTYADPFQLDNVARSPDYASVVADLGDELDNLIECAGAGCLGRPSVALSLDPSGADGCVSPPVTARITSPTESEIVSVVFRTERTRPRQDVVPPFEAAVSRRALRESRARNITVTARVMFADGRRVKTRAKAPACDR
jgi:arylsulfatase A-like enzyme